MLNYNLNINSPLQQEKKNEDVRPPIYWSFTSITSASDSTDLNEQSYGTMNIQAPNTNCINVTQDSSGNFTTDAQYPVTASITGSNWPVTGSTTMSLYTAGITYDPIAVNQYYYAAISASALDIYNNPNITGSKLENNFSASEFYRFYPEGKIIHIKGNVWNPLVKWNQIAKSNSEDLLTDGNFINGNSASFNIVKDKNVSLVAIPYASQSNSGQFYNQYAFNITSSLTASILPNTTGSVTMSFSIPEIGLSVSSSYFNKTSTGIKYLSASFVASNNNPYNVTASIINNKGNMSNAKINWLATASAVSSSSTNAFVSFSIVKEGTTSEVLSYPNLVTNGMIPNDYAFNQTASLSSSVMPFFTGSTYVYLQLGMQIPQINVSSSVILSSSLLTASFVANTAYPKYEITASATAYKTEQINIVLVGGGGGGAYGLANNSTAAGGGGGGGAIFTGSFKIPSNQPYNIIIGNGGNGGTYPPVPDPVIAASNGTSTIFNGYTDLFDTKQTLFISASGGAAGQVGVSLGAGIKGGNGGASGNMLYKVVTTTVSSSNAAAGGTGSLVGSGKGQAGGGGAGSYNNGGNAVLATRAEGGSGGTSIYAGYGGGGGGGAATTTSGTVGGGGGSDGGGNGGTYVYGGPFQSGADATTNTGGGGGGGCAAKTDGGRGADGIAIISYAGNNIMATGGTITYNSGSNTTIHTFTSSGQFQILPQRY